MEPPQPKSAEDIEIKVTTKSVDHGMGTMASTGGEPTFLPLARKIEDYVLRLGYSNTHVLGIVIRILTEGKVRVDFRDYSERLELADPESKTSRTEAVRIFDGLISRLVIDNDVDQLAVTQKIVVQPPRPKSPRG